MALPEAGGREVAPDFAEWLMPVAPAFELGELWLDDGEPPVDGSALATAVPLAREAQNPTAMAPVPSQAETSLCSGWVRWRPLVR